MKLVHFVLIFLNAGLENDGNVMEGLNELNGGKLWTVLLADRKDWVWSMWWKRNCKRGEKSTFSRISLIEILLPSANPLKKKHHSSYHLTSFLLMLYIFRSINRNIARIANAVQVTIWLSITTPQSKSKSKSLSL